MKPGSEIFTDGNLARAARDLARIEEEIEELSFRAEQIRAFLTLFEKYKTGEEKLK